jgi:hypothetical protein
MVNQKNIVGYNKGDKYEDKITKILINKQLLSKDYKRAGASDKTDIDFIFDKKNFNIEIKADENADYGQKYLKWNKDNGWTWSKNDNVIEMYSNMKIIETYIDSSFIPRKFTKEKLLITNKDKVYDQKKFEKPNIEIPLNTLFEYYAEKKCFYIQLQNHGLYYMREDINNLGVPQFDGAISLRLRAKTIYSTERKRKKNDKGKFITINTGKPTPWNYNFLGVIKMSKKPSPSNKDIEELDGREFPFKD